MIKVKSQCRLSTPPSPSRNGPAIAKAIPSLPPDAFDPQLVVWDVDQIDLALQDVMRVELSAVLTGTGLPQRDGPLLVAEGSPDRLE
ncbi:MAG: hypothetical protein IRY99_15095 [Isosphaeraceae bacterium]|nr:hypothetical protein [Isosphaeraceae bacterium]